MMQAGWARETIAIEAAGYAMHGYGQPGHVATTSTCVLYARALVIQDAQACALVLCCVDLGYVTQAMREAALARLLPLCGTGFDAQAFVLTCTHTHSGPGGCSHDVLYNLVTPGFVPQHLDAVVEAITQAVLRAWRGQAPTELSLMSAHFDPSVGVAWNRALRAWNRNPGVVQRQADEAHLALDRCMQMLCLRRDGRVQAMVSFFGVHATCLGTSLHGHDGDNKGRAALLAEDAMRRAGAVDEVLAIFAQATAGDVSPHFHGPGQGRVRAALHGDAELAYAQANARMQADLAEQAWQQSEGLPLQGQVDAVLRHVDFSCVHVDAVLAGGDSQAWTSPAAHGLAFLRGTPVDGPGIGRVLGAALGLAADAVRAWRLGPGSWGSRSKARHWRALYRSQGAKRVVLEAGAKRVLGLDLKRLRMPDAIDPLMAELQRQVRRGAVKQSQLVPHVLPLQIVRIGPWALLCCPGEFTTHAGQRVREAVAKRLRVEGVLHTWICTYCNEYMGYVTTREEYAAQTYEGGHTLYGQWTQAAFEMECLKLAERLAQPKSVRSVDAGPRPPVCPPAELALRSKLPAPKRAGR